MSGINKAIIVGRLGKDPEMSYMPSGDAVCKLSVATSESWKDKSTAEKKERTEWHRIVAFRKLAEICGEYLSKGMLVGIEGKIQTNSWEKDGEKRYSTEIIADTMQMLGGKGDGAGSTIGTPQSGSGYGHGGANQSQQWQPPLGEDDIPF